MQSTDNPNTTATNQPAEPAHASDLPSASSSEQAAWNAVVGPLLAALQELHNLEHERLTNSPAFAERRVRDILDALVRARAAIAKAEGRS